MQDARGDFLSIGQVLRPQGLKGLVKIRPDTDDPDRFLSLQEVFISNNASPGIRVQVSNISVRSGFVYLRVDNDQSIDEAEKRRNMMLFVPREKAVPLGEYENFITDMIGCHLQDTKGNFIGTLNDILQPGANDVYVVETSNGQLLIPALRHIILQVDIDKKIIIVDGEHLDEVSILAD